MEWIAFSIVVIGTIYFSIHYRRFRRGLMFTLLGVAVLAAVGGIVAYFYNQHEEQRRQVARALIKPDQIEIAEATLSIGILSEMKAVVTNNSPYHLAELALRVTVMDCPAKAFDKFDPPPPQG